MTGMQALDMGFPEFTESMTTDEKLEETKSYLVQMLETLRYLLSNLDGENFNETGLKEITEPIDAKIQDVAGNVTELAVTAEGLKTQVTDAEGKASSAQQTAEGVQIDVQNLKNRNTITIDATGLYVTDAAGRTTKLSGNQITSGTIEGVTLISNGTGAQITISNGSISFSGGGGSAKLTQTSRTGLYIEAGSVSGQGISIFTDSFDVSANGGIFLRSPVYISDDLNVAQNISSSGVLKLNAGSSASFDAGGTIYLQSNGGDINIGNGGNIRLNGNVTVNGSPLTTGESGE